MAEATGLRNNALPYPVYGVPFGIVFPILDNDGDPVSGAAALDSERSLNGDTFADCTNEATEIAASSGVYYLLLTAAEMTADVVTVIVKTSTADAKTTVFTLYPRKLPVLRTGTAGGGAAGYIQLDAAASPFDDAYNGCLVVGTLDGNVEARVITDYTGSNKRASVTPNWNTVPDADDTFAIYAVDGMLIAELAAAAAGNPTGNALGGIMVDPKYRALDSEQITNLSAAVGPTAVPAGTAAVLITAKGQPINYTLDGTTPTAAIGHTIPAGGSVFLGGIVDDLQMIEVASGAKADLTFLGHA